MLIIIHICRYNHYTYTYIYIYIYIYVDICRYISVSVMYYTRKIKRVKFYLTRLWPMFPLYPPGNNSKKQLFFSEVLRKCRMRVFARNASVICTDIYTDFFG